MKFLDCKWKTWSEVVHNKPIFFFENPHAREKTTYNTTNKDDHLTTEATIRLPPRQNIACKPPKHWETGTLAKPPK